MWSQSDSLYWTTDVYAYSALRQMGAGNAVYSPPTASVSFQADRFGRAQSATYLLTDRWPLNPSNWFMLVSGYPSNASANTGCFDTSSVEAASCLFNPDLLTCGLRGFTFCFWATIKSSSVRFTSNETHNEKWNKCSALLDH